MRGVGKCPRIKCGGGVGSHPAVYTHGYGANDCDKIKTAMPVTHATGTKRVIVVPLQKRPSLMTG